MRFRDTVTRVRAALVAGAYNQQIPDWANAAETALSANVQPGPATEDVVRQQRTETFARFWLPADTDALPTDRFQWDGDTYEVDGEPQVWKGRGAHVHFVGKKTTQG